MIVVRAPFAAVITTGLSYTEAEVIDAEQVAQLLAASLKSPRKEPILGLQHGHLRQLLAQAHDPRPVVAAIERPRPHLHGGQHVVGAHEDRAVAREVLREEAGGEDDLALLVGRPDGRARRDARLTPEPEASSSIDSTSPTASLRRFSLRMMSNTDSITNEMLSVSVAHVACT